MLQRRILFLSFQKFDSKRNIYFYFFAKDEPIVIIFHASYTREKQYYRRKFERQVTFIPIVIHIYIDTGCPRRNVPDFGRVFLMLKYTDITQNTYVQS